MLGKLKGLLVAVAIAGVMGGCKKDDAADYTALDSTWDTEDSAFMSEYNSVRTSNDSLEQAITAMQVSGDTAAAARVAAAQARITANKTALAEIEAKRMSARSARDAARTANNRAAYDSARTSSDYANWRIELDRIRKDNSELQGTIMLGNKTVGSVDANVRDTGQPLLRVEPGKDDDKPLIRVEPGKDDDKPLIEKNKNP